MAKMSSTDVIGFSGPDPGVKDVREIKICSSCGETNRPPDFNHIAVLAWRLYKEVVLNRETHNLCYHCDTGPVGMTMAVGL